MPVGNGAKPGNGFGKRSAFGPPPDANLQPNGLDGITLRDLDKLSFPPIHWVIEGLLPVGLTLFAGKPKIGKSWLVLALALAAADGALVLGKYKTARSEVLYLALEDNRRRLKSRMRKVLGPNQTPEGITCFTRWYTVDKGGLDELGHWLDEHPACRLVIVDTLGKIRGSPDGKMGIYQQDVSDLGGFATMAHTRDIAIVLVTHTRKMDASDVFDLISGSTGMTGTADTNWVLTKKRGEVGGTLAVTGRDIETDGELAMRFDRERGTWEILGDAAAVADETNHTRIYDLLLTANEPMSPAEIAESLDLSRNTAKITLSRMKSKKVVVKQGRAKWWLAQRVSA